MSTLITGRRIVNGAPVDGTGFAYASDGPLAALLAKRVFPLLSQPITGEWVAALALRESTGGAFESGVGIFPPGNAGPPEHFHPIYDEHFEIITGAFLFRIGGKERQAVAGDAFVVPKGVAHTFRCTGPEVGALTAASYPAARIGFVITTLFGMAHEGLLSKSGQPQTLLGMVIAAEFADDTLFASPPPSVVIPMARAIAPLARRMGHKAVEPKYQSEAFWLAHVEQPE